MQFKDVIYSYTDIKNTFQIILFENSNDIQVNYIDVTSRLSTDGKQRTFGGIENENGTDGLQYSLLDTPGKYKNIAVRYATGAPVSPERGSLQVKISPSGAVSAGARWKLPGKDWQDSMTTIEDIVPGNYTVVFKSIDDWSKPSDATVKIQAGKLTKCEGVYEKDAIPPPSDTDRLGVVIEPKEAVLAGAEWRIDEGDWLKSGTVVPNLEKGEHVVSFKVIEGWAEPEEVIVNIGRSNPFGAVTVFVTSKDSTYFPKTGLLFFPQVIADNPWRSEIGVVNTSDSKTVTGKLIVYDGKGGRISECDLVLKPRQRVAYSKAGKCPLAPNGRYVVFEASSETVAGYNRISDKRMSEVIPATMYSNEGDRLFIPHIASDSLWRTGIALINATDRPKDNIAIRFNDGSVRPMALDPFATKAFTIKSLFENKPKPELQSAVVENAEGLVGIVLFNFTGDNRLAAISLHQKPVTELYFPLVYLGDDLDSGIMVFNPEKASATIRIEFYDSQGVLLDDDEFKLPGNRRYVGTPRTLEFPESTSWLKVGSKTPLLGFEIVSARNSEVMTGVSALQKPISKGVFPKLGDPELCRLGFVNIEDAWTKIVLSAIDDKGKELLSRELEIGPRCQLHETIRELFDGKDITGATYLKFVSDGPLIGFQMNLTEDNVYLDYIPALE